MKLLYHSFVITAHDCECTALHFIVASLWFNMLPLELTLKQHNAVGECNLILSRLQNSLLYISAYTWRSSYNSAGVISPYYIWIHFIALLQLNLSIKFSAF